ncbi:RNA polymerase recycling motor ATPase HelR [Glutamicibacter protophormiae]|uniref:RNA polymerase recycling motor ATPase HelR n=1 Tax=Glutamicibacter protophormiae TaxID=37930 RepID=UPI003BAF313C
MPDTPIATDPFVQQFFALSGAKAGLTNPATLDADNYRLHAIAQRTEQLRTQTRHRLITRGTDRAGVLQQSLERDVEVSALGARLARLDHLGPQACLGFMQTTTGERLFIGRLGLSDEQGSPLMIDWRAPAAEPFFAATHANPQGLVMRRRYRWRKQMIAGYFDEVFDLERLGESTSLDDHSAFLASLGEQRTGKMQDVLATIQGDQDAIIRRPSAGALVVDGGPGTGKTVVALHRAAYLLHADARVKNRGGRVLVVSPHDSYTAYVSDILPNLGEDEVLVSTLSNMVSNAGGARVETDSVIGRIKGNSAMVDAVERAVRVFEQPPAQGLVIETPWDELMLSPDQWTAAVDCLESGLDHNTARSQLREVLVEQLAAKVTSEDASGSESRHALAANDQLDACLEEYWPVLDPERLLRTLYSNAPLLRYCARGLSLDDIDTLLQAETGETWTESDLPLLDAARALVGDPHGEQIRVQRAAALSSARTLMRQVVDDLIASADDKEDLSSQLMNADLQDQLVEQRAPEEPVGDVSAGPFSHVIVDEAQDLTDAQWAMVLSRCPSGSLTIVGDRAQATAGFSGSWAERLARAGIRDVHVAALNINYRTTAQVMDAAATAIRQQVPGANVPVSVRTNGAPVRYAHPDDLEPILNAWLQSHAEGVAAVIGHDAFTARLRVAALSPEQAKGLEFDLVLLYRPERFGSGVEGAVRRYVSMTRATAQLVVLQDPDATRAS